MNRVGIDLGGTKIEGVALRPDGVEIFRQRVPTPAGDYRGIVTAIAGLVRKAEEASAPTYPTVGIGTPGAISPVTGLLKNSNSTALNGMPFDKDLAHALSRPVVLGNDADCFALSEARDGAGAGAGMVFGVIIGTGVGGGLVVGGHAVRGPNAVAGEWGHNPLPWPQPDELPGRSCYCAKTGCIETFLSGPGFEAGYRDATGVPQEAPEVVERARNGEESGTFLSAPEIVQRAVGGEIVAARHLDRYIDRLARSLATIINVVDPDVVVLGGGMSNVEELYTRVPQVWRQYVFGGEVVTRLVPNVHGDSSGVRGAAWLVEE